MIIICSKCGHFAGSNRRNTKLQTSECKGIFESYGAKYAYKQVCDRKHPTHSKGEAKVLEPCFAASALVAPPLAGAAGLSVSPQT